MAYVVIERDEGCGGACVVCLRDADVDVCVGTCLLGAQVGAGVVEAGVCVWLMLWDDGDGGDGREG